MSRMRLCRGVRRWALGVQVLRKGMMSQSRRTRFVIAYDIANDARRTKLANFLLDYGARVQKSVFEADLDEKEAQEILKRAANYMEDGDSFRLYPLCRACVAHIQFLGEPDLLQETEFWIV